MLKTDQSGLRHPDRPADRDAIQRNARGHEGRAGGEDFRQRLRRAGEAGDQVKDILEKTPGAAQVEFETEGRTPQLQIDVKRDVLRSYGLQAARGEQGRERCAGRRSRRNDRVGQQAERHRRADARGISAPTTSRSRSFPSAWARPASSRSASSSNSKRCKTIEPIQHDDGLRRAALMVNLDTRDIEGYVREAERRIERAGPATGELHRPVRRAVRESRGSPGPSGHRRTDRAAPHLPADLPRFRLVAAGAARVFRNSAGRNRGRARALAARHAVQHHGRRGLHRAQRRGRVERPGDDRYFNQLREEGRSVRTRSSKVR